jgi:uncharacterized spore protein YtfJ
MELQPFFQSLKENLINKATVSSVYGDPVTAGNKTVIPVARIAYGFGGGMGTSKALRGETSGAQLGGEGGGGGGGVVAVPVGVVEVTPEATRFIRFNGTRRLIGAALTGLMLGMLLGRRRR